MIPVQTPLPKIPLGTAVEVLIEWIQVHLHGFLSAISRVGTLVNDNLVDLLLAVPPLLMVVVFVLIAWMAKSWRLAVGTAITFLIIISLGQWVNAMETLVLVTLATLTALVFAIPLGIWAARNKYVSILIRPVLDLMQTMPAFVYLIPSVLFFSIGVVPGMFATLIFAMPPGVRMTELGIKQVDKETVEAGRSFLGFYELLSDVESSARLDDEIDTVLDRDFSSRLSPEDRRFLRHWRSTLMEESSSVRLTMTGFSRSLRRFVQSRAFEEHRRLAVELAQAQRLAARVAAGTQPQYRMTKHLDLTGVSLASVGSWRLHNPAEGTVDEEIVLHDVSGLDLEAVRAIVRASEIDMVELEDAVAASVARRGAATVAQVLEDSPATQGLASVIGLLLLARRRGQVVDGVERVTWISKAGRERAASVPRLLFTSEAGEHRQAEGAVHAGQPT